MLPPLSSSYAISPVIKLYNYHEEKKRTEWRQNYLKKIVRPLKAKMFDNPNFDKFFHKLGLGKHVNVFA